MPANLRVDLPNGDTLQSDQSGILQLSAGLPPILAHLFDDDDINRSLIAVADLCNAGCSVTFSDSACSVSKDGIELYNTPKGPNARLWTIPPHHISSESNSVHMQPPASAATVVHHQIHADIVKFHHAALGSPPTVTLLQALRRGYLNNLPLTYKMVSANMPITEATAKGHLDLTRQGQHSTKVINTASVADIEANEDSDHADPAPRDNTLYIQTILHTDATGKLPEASRDGHQYLLVGYYLGFILLEPLKSRSAKHYCDAYKCMYATLAENGHHPHFQRFDNEDSGEMYALLKKHNITPQLVPPANHRANQAERAIRDAKNAFISNLATANPVFPTNLWHEIIPQLRITINLLRPFVPDPKMSAYEGIHGHKYDFIAHPIAPVGTKVIIHDAPHHRKAFAPHGVPGFYLGPAVTHYRCWRFFATLTSAIRISDSVAWFPTVFQMPGSSPTELLVNTIEALNHVFTNISANWTTLTSRQPFEQAAKSVIQSLKDCVGAFDPPLLVPSPTPPAPGIDGASIPLLDAPPIPVAIQRVILPAPQPVNIQRVAIPTTPVTVPLEIPSVAPPAILDPIGPPQLPITHDVFDQNPQAPQVARTVPARPPVPSRQPSARIAARFRHVGAAHAAWARPTIPCHTNTIVSQLINSTIGVANSANALPIALPNSYNAALKTADAALWEQASSEEFIRLIEEWKAMQFIPYTDKPIDRPATYYNPQLSVKIKEGVAVRRVRGTVGGDKSNYTGNVSALTADMPVVKMLFNAAVSEDAEVGTIDIKDYYLSNNCKLTAPEYMVIQRKQIPDAVIKRYNLGNAQSFMVRINGTIYGLPQAGLLAQEKLIVHLADHGFHQAANTPCLFRHTTRDLMFTLVVDDFLVKYQNLADYQFLCTILQQAYTITFSPIATKYLGFTITRDRDKRTLSLTMPGYVQRALDRFQFVAPTRKVHNPSIYVTPTYGHNGPQLPVAVDDSPLLDKDGIKRLQEIIGVFLFYARAVDSTMLTAINKLSSAQARPSERVRDACDHFLAYAASYPSAELVFHASNMHLLVQSDASYLSEPNAKSRVGGVHYLTASNDPDTSFVNGPITCISSVLPQVVSSAFEAEYAGMYINGQAAEIFRNNLCDMGYPQPATTIVSDNASAVGVSTGMATQKRSKHIDVRFHWIRDRAAQGHFNIVWRPGSSNLADYFTKILPGTTFRAMRKYFVQTNDAQAARVERVY